MAKKVDICKRGHPRTPDNIGTQNECLTCKVIMSKIRWATQRRDFVDFSKEFNKKVSEIKATQATAADLDLSPVQLKVFNAAIEAKDADLHRACKTVGIVPGTMLNIIKIVHGKARTYSDQISVPVAQQPPTETASTTPSTPDTEPLWLEQDTIDVNKVTYVSLSAVQAAIELIKEEADRKVRSERRAAEESGAAFKVKRIANVQTINGDFLEITFDARNDVELDFRPGSTVNISSRQ